MGCLQSTILPVLKILHVDVCNVAEDNTTLTADIKCRVLVNLDDKYSDPLYRQSLSVADSWFMTDYVPSDGLTVGW